MNLEQSVLHSLINMHLHHGDSDPLEVHPNPSGLQKEIIFFFPLLQWRTRFTEMWAFHLIITIMHILIISIWIIMYTYHEQKKTSTHTLELPQLGHFAPAACLFRCTCFCRIHDKVFEYAAMNPHHPEPFGKLRHLTVWWCVFLFFFSSSPGWPVFPLKPEQTENNGLWWADQRPCSRTSPSGACPRCDTHRLPPAFLSTMDRRPRGAACHIFSPTR